MIELTAYIIIPAALFIITVIFNLALFNERENDRKEIVRVMGLYRASEATIDTILKDLKKSQADNLRDFDEILGDMPRREADVQGDIWRACQYLPIGGVSVEVAEPASKLNIQYLNFKMERIKSYGQTHIGWKRNGWVIIPEEALQVPYHEQRI